MGIIILILGLLRIDTKTHNTWIVFGIFKINDPRTLQ